MPGVSGAFQASWLPTWLFGARMVSRDNLGPVTPITTARVEDWVESECGRPNHAEQDDRVHGIRWSRNRQRRSSADFQPGAEPAFRSSGRWQHVFLEFLSCAAPLDAAGNRIPLPRHRRNDRVQNVARISGIFDRSHVSVTFLCSRFLFSSVHLFRVKFILARA